MQGRSRGRGGLPGRTCPVNSRVTRCPASGAEPSPLRAPGSGAAVAKFTRRGRCRKTWATEEERGLGSKFGSGRGEADQQVCVWREEGKKRGREGGREEGREGGREVGREGGR